MQAALGAVEVICAEIYCDRFEIVYHFEIHCDRFEILYRFEILSGEIYCEHLEIVFWNVSFRRIWNVFLFCLAFS